MYNTVNRIHQIAFVEPKGFFARFCGRRRMA